MKELEDVAAAVEANYHEGLALFNECLESNAIEDRFLNALIASPYAEALESAGGCASISSDRVFSNGRVIIYLRGEKAWMDNEPDWTAKIAPEFEEKALWGFPHPIERILEESDERIEFSFNDLTSRDDAGVWNTGPVLVPFPALVPAPDPVPDTVTDPILEYFQRQLPVLGYQFRTDYTGEANPTVKAAVNGISSNFTRIFKFSDPEHDFDIYLTVYSFLCSPWEGGGGRRHQKSFFQISHGTGAANAERIHKELNASGVRHMVEPASSDTHYSLTDEILGIYAADTRYFDDFEEAMLYLELTMEVCGNPQEPRPNFNLLERMCLHFKTCSSNFHVLADRARQENPWRQVFTVPNSEQIVACLNFSLDPDDKAGILITSHKIYLRNPEGRQHACDWKTLAHEAPICDVNRLALSPGIEFPIPAEVFTDSGARQFYWILDVARRTIRVES